MREVGETSINYYELSPTLQADTLRAVRQRRETTAAPKGSGK